MILASALSASGLCQAVAAMAQGGLPVRTATSAPFEAGAIALYGPEKPGSAKTEDWSQLNGRDDGVRNVTRPTLTPFLPDPARATGAAVVVLPGGAFMGLAIDHEGWAVAKALASRGIAAFVLKYRVLPTPKDEAEAAAFMFQKMMKGMPDPSKMPTLESPDSVEDGIAALKLVRENSVKWGIDRKRIGMIGFSAGAMTSLQTVLQSKAGEGPAFFGYIYGPQARIQAPVNAPPMFDAIALDDQLFPSQGFPIAQAWLDAKRPVEIHGYQMGNHGFGTGKAGQTNSMVMDEFTAWLSMQGFLTSQR